MNKMNNLISDSDGFLKLEVNNESDSELIVAFGYYTPKRKVYLLENQLNILKKNVLYLSSERSDWFVEPQSFLNSKSIEDSAKKLEDLIKNICKKYNFKKIKFLGYSLGAYGVLVYSKYMSFDLPTVFFVLNSKIDLSVRKIRNTYRVSTENKNKNLYDIAKAIKSQPDFLNRQYIFLFGELDFDDVYSAMYFKLIFETQLPELKFKMISIKDSGHYILGYFKQLGLTYSLKMLLEEKVEQFISQGKIHHALTLDDIVRIRTMKKDLDLNGEFILELKNIIENKYAEFFFGYNRLGVAHIKNNNIRTALPYLLMAHKISPNNVNNSFHLGKCYFQIERYELALKQFSICLAFCKEEKKTLYWNEINKCRLHLNFDKIKEV